MAERAIEILSDETKQREFGKSGREWAIGQFNTERVIPLYERLYEEVVSSQNSHLPAARPGC
jgi:glycosyltransferase involved in cell wall biosynthesis